MLKFDFKKIIHEHITAIVMAVIVGVIIIAPIIIFRFDPIYSGIDFFGTDGESSYIAQVHAVYNGDFSFGNVFLYEYEDQPYVKQPLPAIITAGLGKLFGLYVPNNSKLTEDEIRFICSIINKNIT